jgi:phage gp45-like
VIHDMFEHFDSYQVLSIQKAGDNVRVILKHGKQEYPIIMSPEHKTWHVTGVEFKFPSES